MPEPPAPDKPTAPLTVLISTLDRPGALSRCLRAVLSGTVLPYEILVVDQSAGDATREAVERERSARPLAELTWLRHEGRGLSRSQNTGLRHAGCDVVLVTDDDCVPDPDWVEVAAAAFAAEPTLDLLAGRVEPLGPADSGRLPVSTRQSREPRRLDTDTLPWDVGSGNNFGLRRAALARTGGNDVRLGPGGPLRGGADMDLFRRILRDGGAGRYSPALVVQHERVPAADRLGRRVPYGLGMGACVALWRRQGDPNAAGVLRAWLQMRLHRLVQALRHGDSLRVIEELLVLTGTARGLFAGARQSNPAPQVEE